VCKRYSRKEKELVTLYTIYIPGLNFFGECMNLQLRKLEDIKFHIKFSNISLFPVKPKIKTIS